MKTMVKRQFCSAVLLAVILPAIVLSSFHRHAETAPSLQQDCTACAEHQPHSGHLMTEQGISECLVCQFLGTSFTIVCRTALLLAVPCVISWYRFRDYDHSVNLFHIRLSRAPPVSFCF